MQYALNHSGTRFLSTKNKITQFPGGLRLKELPFQLVPFIILNVMDAFAWFELITKEAIF